MKLTDAANEFQTHINKVINDGATQGSKKSGATRVLLHNESMPNTLYNETGNACGTTTPMRTFEYNPL